MIRLSLSAALLLAACASPRTSVELGSPRVAERGALAYQAAMVGTRMIASVELGLRFELVIRRLDGRTTRELGRVDLGPPDWDITGIATADQGPTVWLSSRDGTVRAVDVVSMSVIRKWPVGSAVTSIAIRSDGSLLAYGTETGVLCIRRLPDGALLQCLHRSDEPITALAIRDDQAASATTGGEVVVWSLPTLALQKNLSASGPVSAMAFSGSGTLAVAIGQPAGRSKLDRGEVVIINKSGEKTVCAGHSDSVTSVQWSRDGSLLTSGALDGTVRLWQLTANQCVARSARKFGQEVTSLVNPPSGAFAFVGLWAKHRDRPAAVLVDYLYPAP